MTATPHPQVIVKSPAILLCRDTKTVKSSLTTLRVLKHAGGMLDCSGATFVDAGFIALLHHLSSVTRLPMTIMLPAHAACQKYVLKHLQTASNGKKPLHLQLRLPTDFPLRRIDKEENAAKEIREWRRTLEDGGVLEEEARSFGSIMSEVLTNSFQHGGKLAQAPIIAGQTFTKQAHSTLVAIDQGKSIPTSLRDSGRFKAHGQQPDHVWLQTALEEGVTALTRPTNRGIGLYQLRKKVEENGGSLCVVSGAGVLALTAGVMKSAPLAHQHFPQFPGTMIILDVKRGTV